VAGNRFCAATMRRTSIPKRVTGSS
jgi:hypothetical protein